MLLLLLLTGKPDANLFTGGNSRRYFRCRRPSSSCMREMSKHSACAPRLFTDYFRRRDWGQSTHTLIVVFHGFQNILERLYKIHMHIVWVCVIHTHNHTHTNTHTHTYTHIYIYSHIYAQTHEHTHIYIDTLTHIHTYAEIHTYTNARTAGIARKHSLPILIATIVPN